MQHLFRFILSQSSAHEMKMLQMGVEFGNFPWCNTYEKQSAPVTLLIMHDVDAVFENTYFSFFSSFKKTWLFTFFLNDVSKSRKKSSAKV